MDYLDIILLYRKVVRKFNRFDIFLEIAPKPFPTLIVAGYTRSGTTFAARILSSILRARYIHEPLAPQAVREISFFHPRESAATILGNAQYVEALKTVFGPGFREHSDRGHRFLYRGDRIVKIVRGNFYLHILSQMLPETGFCVLIRNPASAIASRVRLGWDVPDHSQCLADIQGELTAQQREMLNSAPSIHERLALSWCLDNLAMLRNMSNERFVWVYYEDLLLDPLEQLKRVLQVTGVNVPERRIRKAIDIYRHDSHRQPTQLIRGWEGVLNHVQLDDIARVVEAFGLSFLYDLCTGLPQYSFAATGDEELRWLLSKGVLDKSAESQAGNGLECRKA